MHRSRAFLLLPAIALSCATVVSAAPPHGDRDGPARAVQAPPSQDLMAHAPGAAAAASTSGTADPQVLLFNHGLDFAIPFERSFDFAALPLAGQFRDATQNGIRVRATGLRHWVHLDGSPLGARVARQPDAREEWTIDLPEGSHAFEFKMWESTILGVGPTTCFDFDGCTDVLYRLRVFSGASVLREIDFSPYNDQLNTIALWSSVPITRIFMAAEVNNIDDEFLGTLRVGASPLPAGVRFLPAQTAGISGENLGVHGGRALITRGGGIELWRRNADGAWVLGGQRDVAGTIQRLVLGQADAALAVDSPSGSRLQVYSALGDDPATWPVTEFALPGTAFLALDIDDGLIAVGIANQVRVYRRDAVDGWVFEATVLPVPPIPGSDQFGRSLGLDQDLLAVDAGAGRFHVFQRDAGGPFQEVFRQEQTFTTRSQLDLSGSTLVVQSFDGALRIFQPDGSGGWDTSQFPFAPMPPGIGLALGAGVRVDGDRILALQTFQTAPSVEPRGIASVWTRDGFGQFERSAQFVEPHRAGSLGTQLGSFGRALALDGDDIGLGLPGTPWCQTAGTQAFFGDSGPQNYISACAGRFGGAYVLRASTLGDGLFAGDFEN